MAKRVNKAAIIIPIAVIVVAAVIVLVIVQPWSGGSTTDANYLSEAVSRGDIEKAISASGQLAAARTTVVTPTVAGTVKSVSVEVGDEVEKGDVLFDMTSDSIEDAVQAAKRQLDSANRQVTLAKRSLATAKASTVDTRTADSKRQKADQVAQAKSQLADARANASEAQENYDDAVEARQDTVVTAPRSGVVTAVGLEKGDEVASGSGGTGGSGSDATDSTDAAAGTTAGITIVAYSSKMTLTVQATESEVDTVEVGMTCRLTFDAFSDITATATVTEVAPVGSASGGLVTFPVTITLKDPDPRLKPGMNASAVIVLASAPDVLRVPNTAIEGDETSGWTVQVLDETAGSTQSVPIEVGLADDTYTEVTSGLTEGQVVITGTIDTSATDDSSSSIFGGMGGGMSMGGGMRTFSSGSGRSGSGSGGPQMTVIQERP
ncbi:MAG: efflux RND transporter periplasmic adaptor subunit [Actinomycetes bacterium]|jgi:multidrug efflux pump subunit AcrA (membrane-fusion protein)|nr:efflux RND transporter periplasmic adaptor subunit [Actinomycetes bacterium]